MDRNDNGHTTLPTVGPSRTASVERERFVAGTGAGGAGEADRQRGIDCRRGLQKRIERTARQILAVRTGDTNHPPRVTEIDARNVKRAWPRQRSKRGYLDCAILSDDFPRRHRTAEGQVRGGVRVVGMPGPAANAARFGCHAANQTAHDTDLDRAAQQGPVVLRRRQRPGLPPTGRQDAAMDGSAIQ